MIAATERLVQADGLQWHVKEMGKGETIFLVHGTGASVHSWRDVMPLLATTHHVVAVDLPGHGKTKAKSADLTLPRMARGLLALLTAMNLSPKTVVGHSAGAAILGFMCARELNPALYVSFNGAFYPYAGALSAVVSPIAKMLAFNPFVPQWLARSATYAKVQKLLSDTGSNLSPEGIRLYHELFQDPAHVGGALGMMAAWDLRGFEADLSRIQSKCVFVSGNGDKSVSPDTGKRAAGVCRHAATVQVEELGHLLHEEDPNRAAQIIREHMA